MVASLVAALGLPFATADLSLRADGVWRVVELGNGQVSDRPATTEPSAIIAAPLAAPGEAITTTCPDIHFCRYPRSQFIGHDRQRELQALVELDDALDDAEVSGRQESLNSVLVEIRSEAAVLMAAQARRA